MRMTGEGIGEADTPLWKRTGRLFVLHFFDLIPARRKEKPTIALLCFICWDTTLLEGDRSVVVAFFTFFFATFA